MTPTEAEPGAAWARLPVRLEVEHGARRVRWWETDGERFTRPFLDDDLRRLRGLGRNRDGGMVTGVEVLEAAASEAAPSVIVFHISRCGSTVLTRMLAALPDTLVLSEPRLVDDILRAHRNDPAVTDGARERWLRGALGAVMSSQRVPPKRLVVKLDCWHLFQIERVRAAFPGTPLLFLYRDPVEVLVSLARRPSFALVRGTVTPGELGLTARERDALTPTELAAAILGAFFRAALRDRDHLRPLCYPPHAAVIVGVLPELALDAGDVARMEESAAVHAKEPWRPWAPDSERKRAEASAPLLRAYSEWTEAAWTAWREAVGADSRSRNGASTGPTGASTTR